jgi:cytochrome c biogenesis protein CcmG/thiol:disulfide interchange protein DsbE
MRSWTKGALLALAAVAVGQLLVRGEAPSHALGGDAPALTLPALGGGEVALAALRGKVVAVNFWATWCAPCREELPALAAVWAANKDRCFELLGVVEESARADVEAAAARIPYPILLDARATAAAAWKVPGYPHTFLVDPEGRVRRVFSGALARAELEGAVAQLLPASCEGR